MSFGFLPSSAHMAQLAKCPKHLRISINVSMLIIYSAELLSELRTVPAGYPGTRNPKAAKSAAISFDEPYLVNLFSRKTLLWGGVSRYQPAVYWSNSPLVKVGLRDVDAQEFGKRFLVWDTGSEKIFISVVPDAALFAYLVSKIVL